MVFKGEAKALSHLGLIIIKMDEFKAEFINVDV